jgi:D-glycero-alpha-D-manno-heptose-7-phosphate kinase
VKSPGDIVRARAPLRLGFAGGGTDVSPFADTHGGAVVNATIGLYARVTLAPRSDNRTVLIADDVAEQYACEAPTVFGLEPPALLHRGVYNRFVRDFNGGRPLPVTVHSSVEAPQGSGLGSSSALVVALIEAFSAFLDIPIGEHDLARMAFEIERIDLGLAGGRQDHFAAAFGGFNLMEFATDGRTIVNPLRVDIETRRELESQIVLHYFGQARESAQIIRQQQSRMSQGDEQAVAALHALKADAHAIKDAVLRGDLGSFATILDRGWRAKRRTADGVSNAMIDALIDEAKAHGATAAKLSGAGGGGFLMVMIDPTQREGLVRLVESRGGRALACRFTDEGAHHWRASSAYKS